MQAGIVVLQTGGVNVPAPCACEGVRLWCATTFTFQYANRQNEVQGGVKAGTGIGAAITAEALATGDFVLEVHAPRGNPFQSGEVIGIAAAASGNLQVNPIRTGGS
jgi:hypothetical protein